MERREDVCGIIFLVSSAEKRCTVPVLLRRCLRIVCIQRLSALSTTAVQGLGQSPGEGNCERNLHDLFKEPEPESDRQPRLVISVLLILKCQVRSCLQRQTGQEDGKEMASLCSVLPGQKLPSDEMPTRVRPENIQPVIVAGAPLIADVGFAEATRPVIEVVVVETDVSYTSPGAASEAK